MCRPRRACFDDDGLAQRLAHRDRDVRATNVSWSACRKGTISVIGFGKACPRGA